MHDCAPVVILILCPYKQVVQPVFQSVGIYIEVQCYIYAGADRDGCPIPKPGVIVDEIFRLHDDLGRYRSIDHENAK